MSMRCTNNLDDPQHFYNLSRKDREVLKKWIKENLNSIKTINKHHTSYGLKHYFENDKENKGFYITNGQFKGAMIECGFEPDKNWYDTNWYFCVSEKSITKLEKKGIWCI